METIPPNDVLGFVLAAGPGRRFGALTAATSKCLFDVNGRPLLADIVDKLRAAGLRDILVATGHARERVERALAGRAATVFNPDHATDGPVSSFLHAWPRLAGRWVLFTTGDHFLTPPVIAACLEPTTFVRTLVQRKPSYHPENSRVEIAAGRIVRFGKDIPLARTGGEYIGMALVSPAAWDALGRARETLARAGRRPQHLMDLFNVVLDAGGGPFDHRWCGPDARTEIDTVADLRRARALAARVEGSRP